jgi:hypothetical protein
MEATADRRRDGRPLARLVRLLAWMAAAGCGYVAGFALTLLMAGALEGVLPGGGAGTLLHGLVLTAQVVAWGVLTSAVAAATGAALYGREMRSRSHAAWFLAAGIGIAAFAQFALHEWARLRFGVYSPDYVRGTVFLPAALIAVSVLSFTTRIAPPHARSILAVLLVVPAVWVISIMRDSVTGALDGISREAIPLALAFVAAASYSLVAGIQAARKTGLFRTSSSP